MQHCTFEAVMREAGCTLGNMSTSTPRRCVPHCIAPHCTALHCACYRCGKLSVASARVTTSRVPGESGACSDSMHLHPDSCSTALPLTQACATAVASQHVHTEKGRPTRCHMHYFVFDGAWHIGDINLGTLPSPPHFLPPPVAAAPHWCTRRPLWCGGPCL